MRIKIGDVSYPVDEGSTLTENYNETLDSAVIRISHLTNKFDIEPFDDVVLQKDDQTKYKDFCVDSYDCVQEAIDQTDTTYTYTINLFSLTKKLEGVILPNLSITPYKNESDRISIYEYLLMIREQYSPRHWDEDSSSYVVDWAFSLGFISKFGQITCPEMQWSTPTFRELCNDLTMIGDGVVILKKKFAYSGDSAWFTALYEIDYIDLTQVTIPTNKRFNYARESRSSDDYISEIRMELQNVLQTNVEGINNTVTTTEYLTFSSDAAIITSNNIYLKTQFPILNIKHLWLLITPTNPSQETILYKQDLCEIKALWDNTDEIRSLVREKQEYDSLSIVYRKNAIELNFVENENVKDFYSVYKNYNIYFTRNSNRIDGFTLETKPFLSVGYTTLEFLRVLLCANAKAEGLVDESFAGQIIQINNAQNSYFSSFFQIEYETTYNAVFQASKDDRPRNNKIIADNQTNAWVDAYSQGFLEYQKANRLGNLQKFYNQREVDVSKLYQIGDKVEDNIVYRTEYQLYVDHIENNAYATKDYVLRDYFTGIKSKIRTWVNAREEAFIRHDLKKYYCEFSYESITTENQVESINENKDLAYGFLETIFAQFDVKPIKYAIVKTRSGSEYYPNSNESYALNCITRLIGNSIVITTGFDDNWVVDKRANVGTRDSNDNYNDTGVITKDDIWEELVSGEIYPVTPSFKPSSNDFGGITTNYYKYCDENGEFDYIKIYFLSEFKASNITFPLDWDTHATSIQQYYIDLFKLPKVVDGINTYDFGIDLNLHKDNKEKPVISTQFEFLRADKSISFTKLFLQRQDIIRNDKDIRGTYIRLYDANHNFLRQVGVEYNISIGSVNEYCAYIEYIGSLEGGVTFIEITDYDNKPILSYDITKNNYRLYLNIRRYL